MRISPLASVFLGVLLLSGCNSSQPAVRTWSNASVTAENLAVAAGSELRVGFYIGTLRDDCTEMGKVSVRSTRQPEHGELIISEQSDVATLHFAETDKKKACEGRKYRGFLIVYKPAPGFVGDDAFGVDIIWPTGRSLSRNIAAHVR